MENKEFLKQYRQSGKEELSAQITPDSVNDEQRTIDCVWFTGVSVTRFDWWSGDEYLLSFDPKGADLSRLNSKAPVCDSHCLDSIDCQLGVVLSASKKGSQYVATLQFKRSTPLTGPRPDVDGVWQDVKDGILSKFSMGVELLETVDTRGKGDKLELRTATKWRPYEITLTSVPADFGTTTLNRENSHPPQAADAVKEALLAGALKLQEIEILRLR